MSRKRQVRTSRIRRRSRPAIAAVVMTLVIGTFAPLPPAGAAGEPTSGALAALACTSTALCIAVGSIRGVNTSTAKVLIMRWDGTHWTRMNVADTAGASYPGLAGI